tara:strand:- start:77 stop:247 length:171 start_codon:yes stop_codon:yes gene_type:complete
VAAGKALGESLRFVFGLFFKNYIFLSTLFLNILTSIYIFLSLILCLLFIFLGFNIN